VATRKLELPESPWPFSEEKAAEAASIVLKEHGGRMGRLRLIKLLYFAEREAIRRIGRPIIGGRYVSMDHGPVLSEVYSHISKSLWVPTAGIWDRHVENTGARDVELSADATPAELSRAEIEILVQVCRRFRGMTDSQVRNESHRLPEWRDPGGSAETIPARRIIEGLGLPPEEVESRACEAAADAHYAKAFRQ